MNIIILEKDKNKKGDLFNRMVYEAFHTLGFEKPLYNVPKTGREIDMILKHRTEKRCAIVESKAKETPIGGDEINKFVGAFDVESGKIKNDGNDVVGYVVSKSGFKASAVEQEKERRKGGQKCEIILLGPDEIKRELIAGNVLCSLEKAVDAIKNIKDTTLTFCGSADLLVCEEGWIWVLYYSSLPTQIKTHFAFVHADGNQLLNSIAYEIMQNAEFKKKWGSLTYIESPNSIMIDKNEAQDAYFKYLETELGEIQFEGMPTDQEAGAVKVKLENIFVPLRYNYEDMEKEGKEEEEKEVSIEGVLTRTSKATILAKPGGGKSTLLRRIALAYAYPERRIKIDDGLPDMNWFPIYIRCRDLGENAQKSILEIIGTIVNRAEITDYEDTFKSLVRDMLQEGRVLLLIDGLDEISNERYRINFVKQLRTFVGIYPNVHLLITSRETGYRAVAGTLASYCVKYTIASLNEDEIRALSKKWHQAISGESEQTKEESDKVCNIIMDDARIVALAENPLLLTTLLFVKRWIGYLPTKKCQLYEEMIKLLLVTWNAAAHDKLDMDETEPQLAFVAYHMSQKGEQKITRDELEKCIIRARKELPEILGYTQISASKFIDQVEERSSLLIQLGLEENDKGKLVPSYEFSHLSFQEYLTAKAVAESWIPESSGQDIIDILKPNINKGHWGEIIPLIAVLSGHREAKQIIEFLVELCEKGEGSKRKNDFKLKFISSLHLANCIASEVPMNQELLEKAIVLAIEGSEYRKVKIRYNVFDTIPKSKYGNKFCEIVEKKLFNDIEDRYLYIYSDLWISISATGEERQTELNKVLELLQSENRKDQITGALLMMERTFIRRNEKANLSLENEYNDIFKAIYKLLQEDDKLSIYSASWCLAWSGHKEADIVPEELYSGIANRLVKLWLHTDFGDKLMRMISWGLYSICKSSLKIEEVAGLKECVEKRLIEPKNDFDERTAKSLALLKGYWSKEEIEQKINASRNKPARASRKNYVNTQK